MPRLTASLLCAAAVSALVFALPQAAGAAQVRGNWSSAKPAQQPRRVTPPRPLDFFGIFGGRYRGDVRKRELAPRRLTVTPPPEKPKIYTYVPPTAVPLRGAKLAGEAAGPGLPEAIHRALAEGAARFPVTRGSRKAILKFYAARGYRPVWTTPYGVKGRAFAVIERLARAGEEGLDPALYRLPVVWEVSGDLKALEGNLQRLARFDLELTAAALRYARHASGGVVDPNALSAYHDLKPPRVSLTKALDRLAKAEDPAGWLASLLPRHRAYGILKRELKRLSGGPKEEPLAPVAAGPLIRPGGYDVRIPLIRAYMKRLGFLGREGGADRKVAEVRPAGEATMTDAVAEDDANVYDERLEKAIRDFQRKSGLKPDGIIGKGTLARLNARRGTGKAARARKLALNMERLRWMPRDFGQTYFLANQPAYELYLVKNGKTAWKTRIIIGKPTNQTAFFSDQMELVVFNPYWGVPQSIITREMLPKLLRDPSWLDRHGYEVTDRKGRRISSAAVDWGQYIGARAVPYDVRQIPGRKNALGHIKFLFPNRHSIYMHDTPSRSLFQRRKRAYSHGCVRVQDPLTMAELVTGMDRQTIEEKISIGENERLKLPRKIPVHLAYFTAWPDDAGRVHYYADVYGRDRLLDTALKKTSRALAPRVGNGNAGG